MKYYSEVDTKGNLFAASLKDYAKALKINGNEESSTNEYCLTKKKEYSVEVTLEKDLTSMENLFAKCVCLKEVDLSSLYTSNVTKMDKLFCRCSNLESVNLKNFNTSKVENKCFMVVKNWKSWI